MPEQPSLSAEIRADPVLLFIVILRARDDGEFALAAAAQQALGELGIQVRCRAARRKRKLPGDKEHQHAGI